MKCNFQEQNKFLCLQKSNANIYQAFKTVLKYGVAETHSQLVGPQNSESQNSESQNSELALF